MLGCKRWKSPAGDVFGVFACSAQQRDLAKISGTTTLVDHTGPTDVRYDAQLVASGSGVSNRSLLDRIARLSAAARMRVSKLATLIFRGAIQDQLRVPPVSAARMNVTRARLIEENRSE